MTTRTWPATLLASLLIAAVYPLTAQALAADDPKATMSATVQTVTDDYRQAQLQTAATEEALDDLVTAPDADLKQAFDAFTVVFKRMERIGTQLVRHAAGMQFHGTYYFVEAPKSLDACAFPRSAKYADQRGLDLGENFSMVSETGGEVERAFRAFQFDIEHIHDYLKHHLTPSGIETMDQMFRKATVDSDSLQETLGQALSAMERVKATMPPSAPMGG